MLDGPLTLRAARAREADVTEVADLLIVPSCTFVRRAGLEPAT
ncbi:hypothetical protein [Pseudonocardia sp. ICBG601]|nr:hypothetical protein [Pseudonocardia sp. ICBG601]